MYGPVIQDKLVRLRPPHADDAPVMITWFEDVEVTRFMALHHPPSLEIEKEWMERMARSADDVLCVIEHEGRPVGATAIHSSTGSTVTAHGHDHRRPLAVGERHRHRGDAAQGGIRVHSAAAAQAEVRLLR